MSSPGAKEQAELSWDSFTVTPGILLALIGAAVNAVASWCGNKDGRCPDTAKDVLTIGGGMLFAIFGFIEAISPEELRPWKARRRQAIVIWRNTPDYSLLPLVSTVLFLPSVFAFYDLARTVRDPAGREISLVYLVIAPVFYFLLAGWFIYAMYKAERRRWTSLRATDFQFRGVLTAAQSLINPMEWTRLPEVSWNGFWMIVSFVLVALAVWLRVSHEGWMDSIIISTLFPKVQAAGDIAKMREALVAWTFIILAFFACNMFFAFIRAVG